MKINNVCFCKCHESGMAQCRKCLSLHQSKEKPATHQKDTVNPNIEK